MQWPHDLCPLLWIKQSGFSLFAGVIVWYSWLRHFTFIVLLISSGVEILPVASCYRNKDKLQPNGPLCLYADFTLPTFS